MTNVPTSQSPEYLRTKLYQKEKEFKGFEGLTETDLANVAKKIYLKQEYGQAASPQGYSKDNLTKYMAILRYLTNPNIHLEIKSFDERILYLIMSVDPKLLTFKEFLKCNITPSRIINNEKDPKKKAELLAKRDQEILELQTQVRNQVGFYDSRLLRYEEQYFKKFIIKQELITKVNQDFITKLIAIIPFVTSFNSITNERYQVLQDKAQVWLSETNATNDLFTAAYSCSVQKDTLGLNNILEQLVFLILVGDPELNCLQIYEEESKMDEVQRRCLESFNYYNMNLIHLEKLYHERFCPKKELSPWTFD